MKQNKFVYWFLKIQSIQINYYRSWYIQNKNDRTSVSNSTILADLLWCKIQIQWLAWYSRGKVALQGRMTLVNDNHSLGKNIIYKNMIIPCPCTQPVLLSYKYCKGKWSIWTKHKFVNIYFFFYQQRYSKQTPKKNFVSGSFISS